MTTTLPVSLAEYSDEQLRDFYGASTDEGWHALLEAEMARRDAEQARPRAPRRDDPVRSEWHDAAYSQYIAAEAACNGELVRPGSPVRSGWDLWSGPERRAMAYATEELRNFWDHNPRVTVTAYRDQVRDQREAHRYDQLDRDEASAVRSGASAWQESARVRGDGRGNDVPGRAARAGAQGIPAAGAAAGTGGPVRGGRVSETTGTTARERLKARAAEIRASVASGDTVAGGKQPSAVPTAYERSEGVVAVRPCGAVTRQGEQAAAIAAETLVYAERVLTRHVHWPSQSALDTVLLWCFHANARDRDENGTGPLFWRASPRLLLTSAVRGSGKSTGLDLIAMLTGSRFGRLSRVTAPAFAKLMGKFQEPAMLDEARMIFGTGQKSLDLQGMLLNGYTPRSHNLTAVAGGTADKLFGPVAYAGKDNLINAAGDGIGDLLDRSLVIRMKRPSRHYPDIDEVAEQASELACQGMGTWTSMKRADLLGAVKRLEREAMLDDLDDDEVDGGILRATQLWRSLLAIADVLGGEWPERGRAACEQLSMPGGEYDEWRASLDGLDALWDDAGEDDLL